MKDPESIHKRSISDKRPWGGVSFYLHMFIFAVLTVRRDIRPLVGKSIEYMNTVL